MTMDRHDTIGAMLDEYALGQLSQDERRDVETHVRECDVCAADLRGLAVVMEGIAQTLEPVTPPPALKQRVIASLALEPQEPPRVSADSKVVTLPQKVAVIRRGVHPAWLAAAAVLDPGIGGGPLFRDRHSTSACRRCAAGAGGGGGGSIGGRGSSATT